MSAQDEGDIRVDADINAWIGLSVAKVLARCGTPYEEVVLLDEPPGKLRALEFVCHLAPQPRKLRLQIAYDPSLFSESRGWARSLVEAQSVTDVVDQGKIRP